MTSLFLVILAVGIMCRAHLQPSSDETFLVSQWSRVFGWVGAVIAAGPQLSVNGR